MAVTNTRRGEHASLPPGPGTTPPGRAFLAVLGGLGLLTAGAISAPGGYFLPAMLAMLGWCVLAGVWGVWLLLAAVQRAGRAGLRRRWRRWLLAPLWTLVIVALAVLDAPMRVRLALSEPALLAISAALERGEPREPGWYGLYTFTRIEKIPGGARFQVEGTGFLEIGGFAYVPADPPPELDADEYRHFSGPWYVWTERW